MDSDDFGDLDHGEWLELSDSMFQEIALAFDDFLSNPSNGILALMEALDEEFARSNFVSNILPSFRRRFRIRQQILIRIRNSEVREVIALGRYHPFVAHLRGGHFGLNITGIISRELPPGSRIQPGDPLGNPLGVSRRNAEVPGNLRETMLGEGLEMIAQNAIF